MVADWDPDPDYFFHWLRDSAIAMCTLAELLMEGAAGETEQMRRQRYFDDFVRFSMKLTEGGGQKPQCIAACTEADSRFLRPAREIEELAGDALLAEPRFNPDGTIDIFRWSRPQYDGPALRALACLRYLAAGGARSDEIGSLLRRDLDFTVRHAGEPCIGPWEEPGQNTHHYYVELAQLGGLVHARCNAGFWSQLESSVRRTWLAAEQKLRENLEQYWSEPHRVILPMRPIPAGEPPDEVLDAVVLVAVWDADLPEGPHSVCDPRVWATQNAIERLFVREFPINSGRADGPALGRSRGDRYFGGGAWYPTTLAAAGLCYRAARRRSGRDRAALIGQGDRFMATLRDLTPDDGSLSEQLDRTTGKPRSARDLTWSHAAFVGTARERRRSLLSNR